ncbi:GNAT family N-acetyltransferase [Clostridium sp. Marseille-QA1073]
MEIIGSKIYIRYFKDVDVETLFDLNLRNKEFFQKYSPTHDDNFYTLDSQRKFISDMTKQRENDDQYCFGIFVKDSNELIGYVNLFQILRGPLQSCLIGYSLDKQQNGNGYATEAVSLAVRFAFNELKLHRIEAGVMLTNTGSMRVLEKVGFHKEGIAQKNVKINGQWQDHQVFAIISDKD